MIAIHNNTSEVLFHYRWIDYCKKNNIPYKLVNCYDGNIIEQLEGCTGLMWHYHQANVNDIIMAKPLMYALEQSGIKVFPNFNSAWHFDDKVGQKYLFESLEFETVNTWVFYDKQTALKWLEQTTFPIVFKLRGGAASQNVKLVRSKIKAQNLVNQAFDKGFSAYDAWGSVKERLRKWRSGKTNTFDIMKGLIRLVNPPRYAKIMGNEINYIYFQEFLPNNDSDTRIIVIDGKAFALKRMVRANDFRASGSGDFQYEREVFDERCVKLSFQYSLKLNAQCVAYDYVFDVNNNPKLVEISYGFANKVYDPCTGYWDEQMNWHAGSFDPYGWMVDLMVK
jgi:hypothetical protein